MSEFKIEKGIPIPPGRGLAQGPKTYPFEEMEVGDSFVAPTRAKKSIHPYQVKSGHRFTSRNAGDGKVRIWRIA